MESTLLRSRRSSSNCSRIDGVIRERTISERFSRLMFLGLLAGCASTSDVAPFGDGAFLVTAGDPGGTTASATLLSRAVEGANEHCAKQGKKVEVKESAMSGTRWTGTNAKLVFGCK